MRRFGCMLLAVLASSIFSVITLLAQSNGGLQFTLTDLGAFGGSDSICNAINNKRQIVGYIYKNTGTMCFSWQPRQQSRGLRCRYGRYKAAQLHCHSR